MTSPQRSKAWGYEVEVAALKALRSAFPNLARTGSVNYKKAAPDLTQKSGAAIPTHIRLVVTRDKGRPLLVTMSAADFLELAPPGGYPDVNVDVQVKGRTRTWIGTLYQELKDATSWRVPKEKVGQRGEEVA